MTKLNPFVKNLKNISKSINSLLERNLNKLKFDNFKISIRNNKIILTFVAVFVLLVSYLLQPTFYKQVDISKKLKKELLTKFNLDFTFTQKLKYNFLPRPHFITNESFIIENQKNIAEVNQIKIYIAFDNLFSSKNISINGVIIENANFQINTKNSNFFLKILNNNFLDTYLKIKKSNIFFKDAENEILFINKIKNLKYFYDQNELKNIFYSENEIFNTPYSLEVINHEDDKKIYTKVNFDTIKFQIDNTYNYSKDIQTGSADLVFNKIKSSIKYKSNSNYFEFNYLDKSDKQKFSYNGKLNFRPFYSTLEGFTEEINISNLFGSNAIFAELLKTEIFNSENIDLKIEVNANKIKNSRKFTDLFIKSKIHEGLIDIDDTKIEWKDNSVIKFTDTLIFIKDGKLFLDGKSKVNIINIKNIYKFLLTPKNFRKKIKTIDFNFSYIFDEKTLILNDINIDGKYNQKVNKKLYNFYFRDSDMQNKILFKNLVNDLLEAYAG